MDDKSKKASLRGRGRELMRGLNPRAEDETRKDEQESPFFDDDSAVMSWMDASGVSESPPPMEEKQPLTEEEIFAEPNFDEFFPEEPAVPPMSGQGSMPDDTTIILPSEEAEDPKSARSLEEIFTEPDAAFGEIFGDVVRVDDEKRKVALATPVTTSDRETAFDATLAEMAAEFEAASRSEAPEPEEFDLDGFLASHSDERSVMGLPLGLAERREEDIPSWYAEAAQPLVEPPLLEPEEAIPDEAAMPAPLPTSERDTAFGMGSPDDIHEGFIEAVQEESPLTRAAALIDQMEAIPPVESRTRPIDLRGMKLERPALAEITPIEPEYLPEYEQLLPTEEIPMPTQELAEEWTEEPSEAEVFMPAPQEEMELGGVEETEEEEPVRRTGFFLPDEAAQPAPDPFSSGPAIRRPAREVFAPSQVASDADLLKLFIDDARMRELFTQIEALQEEVVASVRGERGNMDTYQEELLHASNLLLQSRENYDEARATVYRVRADLARERRVAEDIARYRPTVTIIYIAMAVLFPVFILLGQLFTSVAESVGVPWFGQSYYPAMAGYLGALLFSARTLYKHTSIDPDFDPIHLNWYLMNPLLGLLTGFLVYLFIWTTVETSLSGNASEVTGKSGLAMLLAAAAGYNQNLVTGILGSVQNRFSGGSKSSSPPERS